jgi:hypothetical protein
MLHPVIESTLLVFGLWLCDLACACMSLLLLFLFMLLLLLTYRPVAPVCCQSHSRLSLDSCATSAWVNNNNGQHGVAVRGS